MFSDEIVGPTVEVLAELAAGGQAVEFAIDTGRVAIPLSETGIEVSGIELSHDARTTYLRIYTANSSRVMSGITTCRRSPPGRAAIYVRISNDPTGRVADPSFTLVAAMFCLTSSP